MTSTAFPHLFSPLAIGGVTLKNRVLSSGHDTVLVEGGQVTDDLVAYHEARAEGGVGLIVVQVAGVHETARYTTHVLMATDDSCVEGTGGSPRPRTGTAPRSSDSSSIRDARSWSRATAPRPSRGPRRRRPVSASM